MTTIKSFSTVLFSTLCLTSFAQTKRIIKDSSNNQFKQKDTSYWIENFRQFREALYRRDISKAKAFFDFPFTNEGNEIWYLVYAEDEKAFDKFETTLKPFTEADFNKFFDKIFSKQLINSFLKLKTNELYEKGKSKSPEFKDSSATYVLYAIYSKEDREIILNFAIKASYEVQKKLLTNL